MSRRIVHGDDLLYRFFNQVLPSEPELFTRIPKLLVLSMSVWIPKDVYQAMPVILPWVIRDPSCRGKRSKGKVVEADEWGSPNAKGYLRDDNSLVKGIPRSLMIKSERHPFINGRHLGSEFVASHIWRHNETGTLASRIPMLNTFVPNLVWLPSQIAKLSDKEDGVFQRVLKEISWTLYRDVPLTGRAADVAERSWALLPKPSRTHELLDEELNWFMSTPRFLKTRRKKLDLVVQALDNLSQDLSPPLSLQPSRFRQGLPAVSRTNRNLLRADLQLHQFGIAVEVDSDFRL